MINQENEPKDPIAQGFATCAQWVLLCIFGLLPLVFVPIPFASFEYTKVIVVLIGVFVAFILLSLSVLRSGIVRFGFSYALYGLWVAVLASGLSSLLSGDLKDSLVGDFFSIHATVFVALLALVATVWMLAEPSKATILRLYIVIAGSTLLLVIFHSLRIYFGPEFLSFGVFTSATLSPVGTWNDLALFLGLTIILSLVALEQLTLTTIGKILFGAVILLSLGMLATINFFTVWLILGLTSLAIVVYTLGRDRFTGGQLSLILEKKIRVRSLPIACIVFAISVLFIVGGATFGGFISERTGINYVEVRPSFGATIDITRQVYEERAFLGVGANKFVDAWRLYKDSAINPTVFWNTDFNAGSGYIPTSFVTTGILGGLAWLLFLGLYIYTGVRTLLTPGVQDKHWYFIGVSSFVGALYIWGMSIVYVPGVVMLILGALCTGISLYAFRILSDQKPKEYVLHASKQTGFMLTLAVIVIITGSVGVLYVAGRHYTSVYAFNESVVMAQAGAGIDDLEREVLGAYTLSTSDVFARRIAEFQFARMRSLAATENPTEEDQRVFQAISANAINAALKAVELDKQEPANWSTLGGIYGFLGSLGVQGASDKAREAFQESVRLNPKNPLPLLELAVVEARDGRIPESRSFIEAAVRLKPNYSEAFQLLSQLEVATGNVNGAIASTQAIITLEPRNAARYYQLGVLESARNNIPGAIPAYEKAIELDPAFANARYLLALAYDQVGQSERAKQELEKVLELNPGNADVINLIGILEREGSLASLRTSGVGQTISEPLPATDETTGTVQTTQETETPLVNPVNTPPAVQSETEVTQ